MCALGKRLAALTLALVVIGVEARAHGGGDCPRASAECDQARESLSEATREADVKAAAYVVCSEGGGACGAQKKALDQAMQKKRRAQEAYRFAAARRKAACG